MPDLVPGYPFLGLGFDGFGSYDQSSSNKARLFDTSVTGFSQWTNPTTKTTYTLPANVSAGPLEAREQQSVVFESRSEIANFFKAQAGAKASYLSFSGSLSASFERISKSSSEYYYGMAYSFTDGYELSLVNMTNDHLAPEVLRDPDFANLPQQYNDQTRIAFFRLFEKYGTHFVSSVKMGGRIFYDSWIEKSYGMTKDDVTASLGIEFKAVFNANAKVEWNQLSEVWTSHRQTHIQAIGGDDNLLNGLGMPAKGESYATQYSSWVNSVGGRPGPVGFKLTGIETLFKGEQYEAVKQASDDYLSRTIRLQSSGAGGTGSIVINGQPAWELPAGTKTGVGYAILDRASLELLQSGNYHYPTLYSNDQKGVYDHLAGELKRFQGHSGVIVAILFWDIYVSTSSDFLNYPSPALYDLLLGLGAGDGLSKWLSPRGSNSSADWVSYAIVGVPGGQRGSSIEDINFQHDSGKPLSTPNSIDLEVFLRPESTPTGIAYTPA